MKPTISVIIPAYNYAHYVGQAIESVLAQTLPAHEIIVVDDGSTDDTSVVLARYSDRIQVIYQENRGLTSSRNNGATAATGNYLAFLDADDVWLPRKLEHQIQLFENDPVLGLVHCGVEDIDAIGEHQGAHLDGMEGHVSKEMLLFQRPVILGGGSGVLIPRKVFEEIHGFDARLSTSGDWDLYYRIASRWKVGFVPEVLLQYRRHGSNMHSNIRAMEHDMLLAYDKVFSTSVPEVKRIRRQAYGRLHMVLAGSFFSVGQKREFFHHCIKSLLFSPSHVIYLLMHPLRQFQSGRLK